MMTIRIIEYENKYKESAINLITRIQTQEFKLPVTLKDQPDLQIIETFYQRDCGNFWLALNDEDNVVGTVALIDIGNGLAALRKMFVAPECRGKDKRTAQYLLDTLLIWCKIKKISAVYLGTISIFLAAQRFYEKNGFKEILISELPQNFPIMPLDTKFYAWKDDELFY